MEWVLVTFLPDTEDVGVSARKIMKRNLISKKLRKKMNNSGKSSCPICHARAPLVEHHISGRKIKSPNRSCNLCNICPTCHMQIHLGRIILEGWFKTTNGMELFWHKLGQNNFTGEVKKTYIIPQ